MNWIRRVWRGETRLVIAFWLYGVAAILIANVVVSAAYLPVARLGPIPMVGFVTASTLSVMCYQVVVAVGIWRSAGAYSGWRPWAWLARGAVLVSCALVAGATLASAVQVFRMHDSSRSSRNAAATLRRDPAYPFSGFWKESCTKSFGLLIEPSTVPGMYSVSFCGPGGCFAPGSYRPDTSIAGDPAYRVVDHDRLEVRGQNGFGTYLRCQ